MKRPIENMNAPLSKELLEKAANGNLTQQEAQALTELMEKDPFVAEVLESVDMDKVRESIVQTIEDDAEKRGDGTSLAGTFIRLAWHW